jgi:hypothetical protein
MGTILFTAHNVRARFAARSIKRIGGETIASSLLSEQFSVPGALPHDALRHSWKQPSSPVVGCHCALLVKAVGAPPSDSIWIFTIQNIAELIL